MSILHNHDTRTETATTQGFVIRWAKWYDPLVQVMTLGQANRLRRNTVALAKIRHGDAVLDVGCGSGDLTLAAWQATGEGASVAGIDPSAEMIDAARQKANRHGANLDLRVGVIETLPFADNSFDIVLSSLMMHHLPGDLQVSGLAEIQRVLRPGGRLVVVDFSGPTSRLGKLAMLLLLHGGHQASIDELAPLLQNAGLTQIDAGGTTLPVLGYIRGEKAGGV